MGPSLADLKIVMETLRFQMKVLEEDLQRDPVPKSILRMMLRETEKKWNLVSKYHAKFKYDRQATLA